MAGEEEAMAARCGANYMGSFLWFSHLLWKDKSWLRLNWLTCRAAREFSRDLKTLDSLVLKGRLPPSPIALEISG